MASTGARQRYLSWRWSQLGRPVPPAADITAPDNGTRLTFRTPSCAAGNTTLTVATSDGVSNAVTFRYVGPVLPVTGSAVGARVALGLGIVLVGALLVLLTRRRRT